MSTTKKNKRQSNKVIDVEFKASDTYKLSSDVLDAPKTGPAARGDKQPDANVDLSGHCIQPAYAENDRPDTGDPCLDGRDGR